MKTRLTDDERTQLKDCCKGHTKTHTKEIIKAMLDGVDFYEAKEIAHKTVGD